MPGAAAAATLDSQATAASRRAEEGLTMFHTIVWATDGSELAARALPFAKEIALADDAELVVVHVNQLFTGRASGWPVYADEPDLREGLEEIVGRLVADGVRARLLIVTSGTASLGETIAEAARHARADLIVTGTHGRGAIGTALLGSVTKKLIHFAGCPVLAIPVTHLPAAEEVAVTHTAV
jgi:nucleotide-binding universal stress UspA family protein